MALKPETQKWLESLPLAKETKEALQKEIEADEKKENAVRETVMARSDYSRSMDEARSNTQKALAEAKAAKDKADAMLQANTKWREDNIGYVNKVLAEKSAADQKLAAAQARLKMLADEGVIRMEDEDYVQPAKTPQTSQTPDPNQPKFMTQKEMEEIINQRELRMAFAMANFGDLADEHYRLFGTQLKRQDLIKEMAGTDKTLEQVWEEKYGVAQKRKELDDAALQKRIDDAVAAERVKILSEIAITPGAVRDNSTLDSGMDKHILNLVKPTGGNSSGVSDAVRAASQSWARGEFHEKTPA